jgi:hypothetical protein
MTVMRVQWLLARRRPAIANLLVIAERSNLWLHYQRD